jgi:hypothetical protein
MECFIYLQGIIGKAKAINDGMDGYRSNGALNKYFWYEIEEWSDSEIALYCFEK